MTGNRGGPMSLAKPALKWSLLGGTRQRRGSSTLTRASIFRAFASSAGQNEARRSLTVYNLPVEEVPREHRRQGADDHKAGDEQLAGRTSGPAEPGPAGLDQLLPAWSVQGDLQLPASLCMAQGGELASPQAPACQLEVAPRSLPTQVVADGGWGQDVRPIGGDGEPLPLPGRSHPLALERAHGSCDS